MGGAVLHAASLAVALSFLWLLLSGHFADPLLLGLGLASVIVVTFIAHRMDLADREGHPVHLSWRALIYWPWLIKEIVMANIEVAKAITRTSMDIEPTVIRLKASQTSELGRVIYANSITLTPGTVTIGLEGEDLTVHALTRGSKEGLETGEMDRKVTAMAGSD
jgi:multicomponent Na+:H+ antiporter subunit E